MTRYAVGLVMVALLLQNASAAEEEGGEGARSVDGIEFLGRNVRLDFRMVPQGPDDDPFFIVTAVSQFKARASFETDEGSFSFHVEGQVDVTEEGLLLVVYEAELSMNGIEGGGETQAASGVLLKPGRELGVAQIGERTLMIKATYLSD